jgi:alpha-tubulin suppressor-like RCC1 family protein
MAFTQITSSNLDNTINTKLAAAEAANAAVANIVSLAISSVQIADSSYNVLDDTAANTGGGYLVINGTGFTNQCVVIVGTTNATSTTFANTKQLRAQVPALSAATYPVYVVDSVTGATAIKVNGLTYSSFPAWSTGSSLSNQAANTAFGVNLSATSDSSVTYANTTALPAGTTLAANGYFSGTVSIGAQTTYSFDVKATDVENQDATRTFSLTVTVTPQTRLYGWGNNNGQLGINDTITQSSPVQVGTATNWNNVITNNNGAYFTAATKTDGTLWLWGQNSYGQLGTNNVIDTSSPVQVGTNTNWSKAATGSYWVLAIKTDGTLWTWGYNGEGQSGLNDRVHRSSPVQVGTGTDWSTIPTRVNDVNFAIKTNGTLWTWGSQGFSGVFGINTQTGRRSSPVQVGTDTNWATVEVRAQGIYTAAGIKTDGTLWLWGDLKYGFAGLNNTSVNYRSSPTQVGTGTTWSTISLGAEHWLATQTNNTLWACGKNNSRTLGDPTIASGFFVSSPIQIGSSTNWSQVEAGYRNSWAIRTDKTLWAWGDDARGALGFNTNYGDKSSPTQIGTSTWKLVRSSGYRTVFAITTN